MLYDYDKKDFNVKKDFISTENGVSKYRVEYKSFVQTPYEESNSVIGYLFVPEKPKTKTPLVFLHGMGDKNLVPLIWYPRKFAESGIPSFLMILPFHFERTPKGMKSGKKVLLDDMPETIQDFRQSVIDVRTSMDFLKKEGLSSGEFALMGVSFGGMVGAIAMGVDDRIKKGIFVIAGGNFRYITWKSLATRVLRKKYEMESNTDVYGCTEEKCEEIHKNYFEYIHSLKTPEDLDRVPYAKECFLFDPLTFAHFIRGRKVVMYSALFDEIIPKKSANELWEEMGRPERHWLFADHITSIFYKKSILERGVKLILEE
ncbi:MAG: alpha/beta hydrolase family protein [Caldisericaceae bacterium]|nr:alpha/beta hydrolase family protein [Caldisericaceae bacterium]